MKHLPIFCGCFLATLISFAPRASADAPSLDGCVPVVTETSWVFDGGIPETPAAAATIAIPVTVTGNGKIIDVDFSADINHARPSDLTYSLISPTGTEVTLSSNNNSGRASILSPVTFSDQADRLMRQLSGSAWADNLSVGDVRPDEPLGTFEGEAPNGNWVFKIRDTTAGTTGGVLDGRLTISTCASTLGISDSVTFSNSTAAPIPDNVGGIVRSSVTVTGMAPSLCKLSVLTNISHTFSSDVVASLISPQGTEVLLTDDIGSNVDNVFVNATFTEGLSAEALSDQIFVEPAAPASYPPLSPLSQLDGIDPNGTWTLKIFDDANQDTGTLNNWSLILRSCSKDTDQDGLGDNNDTCPSDPAKNAPGVCGCGVADADSDSSGVTDCLTGSEFLAKVEALKTALQSIKVPKNTAQRPAAIKAAKNLKKQVAQLLAFANSASPAISFKASAAKSGLLNQLSVAANALAGSVTQRTKSAVNAALNKLDEAVNE